MTSDKLRPDGWEERLSAFMKEALTAPWCWGEHDCATFAWKCARAILDGATPWDKYMGKHHTELGAGRLIKKYGDGSLVAAVDSGGKRIPLKFAQRGDIVAMLMNADGEYSADGSFALGVLDGEMAAFAAAPVGLRRFNATLCALAWSVEL